MAAQRRAGEPRRRCVHGSLLQNIVTGALTERRSGKAEKQRSAVAACPPSAGIRSGKAKLRGLRAGPRGSAREELQYAGQSKEVNEVGAEKNANEHARKAQPHQSFSGA
jgi:hypothetical protein